MLAGLSDELWNSSGSLHIKGLWISYCDINVRNPYNAFFTWFCINVLKADNFRSVFLSTYISAMRHMCPPQRHPALHSGSPNAMWELLRDAWRGLACLIQYRGLRYLVFMKDSCLSCLTLLFSISWDAVSAECSYWACSHQCKLLQYWIATLMLNNHLRLLWWSS